MQWREPVVLAALFAMFIATARLCFSKDDHACRYVFVTWPSIEYLLFHGFVTVASFLTQGLLLRNWSPPPYLPVEFIAFLVALGVNELFKFEGFELPEAPSPLRRLRDDVRTKLEERMLAAEHVAMSEFLAPYAKGRHLSLVRQQIIDNIPRRWPVSKAAALRTELESARTVERAIFIRYVDKRLFLHVFSEPQIAQLSLFERAA